MGAWIEIVTKQWGLVARGSRPRKGAWIEIIVGVKVVSGTMSPPQGGVD